MSDQSLIFIHCDASLPSETPELWGVDMRLEEIRDDRHEVIAANDYYPYGMTIASRTFSGDPEKDKFKFQSKERDAETGYDYFEARYYDSSIGRFLQVDPHGEKYENISSFGGMYNNPLLIVDPTGKDSTIYLNNLQNWRDAGDIETMKLQVENVLKENGIDMKVKIISSNYVQRDKTDIEIRLLDTNSKEGELTIKAMNNKVGADRETPGISAVGSGQGRVLTNFNTINGRTPDSDKNLTNIGFGNAIIHEGFHAMGLAHGDKMASENSFIYTEGESTTTTKMNKEKGHKLNKAQVDYIKNVFLKK